MMIPLVIVTVLLALQMQQVGAACVNMEVANGRGEAYNGDWMSIGDEIYQRGIYYLYQHPGFNMYLITTNAANAQNKLGGFDAVLDSSVTGLITCGSSRTPAGCDKFQPGWGIDTESQTTISMYLKSSGCNSNPVVQFPTPRPTSAPVRLPLPRNPSCVTMAIIDRNTLRTDYSGEYRIVGGEEYNGHPLWKHVNQDLWFGYQPDDDNNRPRWYLSSDRANLGGTYHALIAVQEDKGWWDWPVSWQPENSVTWIAPHTAKLLEVRGTWGAPLANDGTVEFSGCAGSSQSFFGDFDNDNVNDGNDDYFDDYFDDDGQHRVYDNDNDKNVYVIRFDESSVYALALIAAVAVVACIGCAVRSKACGHELPRQSKADLDLEMSESECAAINA